MKSIQLALALIVILVFLGSSWQLLSALTASVPKDAPLSPPAASQACTSFCLQNDGYCIFATNFDSFTPEEMPGILYVNKRDVLKTGWEQSTTGEVARWTSRYGSVTFNLVGYQFPWAGMNEAGLIISTMSLVSLPPKPDARPPLETEFWLQYQLDNYSSVEEVIASESQVRIVSKVLGCCHFLVCDRKGDCATVEMLNGKMVYHVGETLPVAALTNSIYAESVKAWQERTPEELARVEESALSLLRFTIAADAVTRFQPTSSEAAVRVALDTLARASIPDKIPNLTVWGLVFDAKNLRVYFRSRGNSQIRSIDFSRLDFACSTPVLMLDIQADLAGDISDDLGTYDHDASLDQIAFMFGNVGIAREQAEALLLQLERFPCADRKAHIVEGKPETPLWIWLIPAAALVIISVDVWYRARKKVERT